MSTRTEAIVKLGVGVKERTARSDVAPRRSHGAQNRFTVREPGRRLVVARSAMSMSEPGDAQELEADRAAAQVMAGGSVQVSTSAVSSVARACAACEEEKKEEAGPQHVQRSAEGGATITAPAGLMNGLGSGRGLDRDLRSFMESRFRHDFGGVRVHEGAAANDAARRPRSARPRKLNGPCSDRIRIDCDSCGRGSHPPTGIAA